MDEGYIVLLWMQENGHTMQDVAAKIGYSPGGLSHALRKDRITPQLSEALFKHFWLRVPANTVDRRHLTSPTGRMMGRPPGRAKALRWSKLDPYRDEIIKLLKEGEKQSEIALRCGSSNSNLHVWMKKNGLTRKQQSESKQKRAADEL